MAVDDVLVAVVDDDDGVCRSVSRALETHGFRVQTFANAQAYIEAHHTIQPTCVLADIRMPGMDGFDLQRATRELGDDAPIVFMTAVDDVPTVVEAMKAGASDLLAKPFTTRALLGAIDAAIARARTTTVEHRSLAELWRALERLTPRETEIAALVASGRLNKQVAAITGITEKTVKVHRARAMRKLNASSLAELVRIVDRLIAQRERRVVHVDGSDVPRPSGVDIMVHALGLDSNGQQPARSDDGGEAAVIPDTRSVTRARMHAGHGA